VHRWLLLVLATITQFKCGGVRYDHHVNKWWDLTWVERQPNNFGFLALWMWPGLSNEVKNMFFSGRSPPIKPPSAYPREQKKKNATYQSHPLDRAPTLPSQSRPVNFCFDFPFQIKSLEKWPLLWKKELHDRHSYVWLT
jgi:hypothetical protein